MPARDVQRSVLNRLQLALAQAILLIGQEREHHALSYRSIRMMSHYAQIFPEFLRSHLAGLPEAEAPNLMRWLEWVQITRDSAIGEQQRDFERTNRGAVIILADILEGAVESVVATCLMHMATGRISLRELTGHKGGIATNRELRFAVRTWERNLYRTLPSRVERLATMISTFFPRFALPSAAPLLNLLFERRNQLTHEIIVVSDKVGDQPASPRTAIQELDGFYDSAGELVIAIIQAIPGDLAGPLPAFDPEFRMGNSAPRAP